MKILLTNSTPFYSGGELFVYDLAKELTARGHQLVVSTQPGHLLARKCRALGATTVELEYGKSIAYMKLIGVLRRAIERHGVELVHSNSDFDRTYAGFAARLAKVPHVASIHSQHSINYNVVHWMRNKFAIDHFLVDGEPTRKILVNDDRIANERITILRLGIDVSILARNDDARKSIRRRYELPDDALIIGNVARLVPFKGHAILLQTLREILTQRTDVYLLFIGDGVLRDQLSEIADSLGIARHVRFAGFQDAVHEFYPAMDIYSHPSLDHGGESFPLAVLQAMAAGLPIVASRVGDIPIMLDNQANGLLVEPGNVHALCDALLTLVRNPDRRERCGASSRAFVHANFTVQRMTDAVESIYRTLRPSAFEV